MSVANKIRIYDLSKELKQDTKRIIEDARREGVDVTVPSNTVPKEVAEKIRNKYFPKKETATARTIKVVKKTFAPSDESSHSAETENGRVEIQTASRPEISERQVTTAPKTFTVTRPMTAKPMFAKTTPLTAPKVVKPQVVKLVKTETPEAVSEPETIKEEIISPSLETKPVEATATPPVERIEPETPIVVDTRAEEKALSLEEVEVKPKSASVMPTETVAKPEKVRPESAVKVTQLVKKPEIARPANSPANSPANIGTQVRKMTLTSAALKAGLKPGEKVVVAPVAKPAPPKIEPRSEKPKFDRPERNDRFSGQTTTRTSNRFGEKRAELRATPGESVTPQTVYTPPPDSRKPGRNAKKGGAKHGKVDAKGKFQQEERDFFAPKFLPIDIRLQQQLGVTKTSEVKTVRLVEGATVRDLAEKIGVAPRDIVQLLMKRGVFATLNQPLNTEVATDIGKTLGYEVAFVPFEEMIVEQEFEDLIASDSDDVELPRAPVVTVMGHVDHGKTSLLDAIRLENVAGGEAGGITQHIGAYSVYVPNPDNLEEKRRVVFLDTPGHEAFTMMRARGAKATDVVVLVVAADDGVMPQTIEAIEHAKAAKVPIVVAINKIDKPEANINRVKQELSGQGLQPLDWGGDTEMVEVSAKKKENLDSLLETILLTADILELKASPTRLASGVVLEAKLDKGRGSVATVLVQQGTMRVGDPFIVGNYYGKVRAMFSDLGEIVNEASPATPVEVLGLQGVPQAGDALQVVADIERAQNISNQRLMQARQAALIQTTRRGLDSLGQAELKELLVVLKADVQGSVEVLKSTLEKLSTGKVKVRVIRSGVGAITESDVLLASATQADDTQTAVVIIGFNVRPESRASEVAKTEDVDIRLHSIIYKIEEEIRAAMIGMLDAIEKEVVLGKAEVRDTFKVTKVGTIAGCGVVDGVIRRQARARLIRDSKVIWEGEISSLKRFKEDASEVRQGYECGIGLVNFNDIKVGDFIEAYIVEKIAATTL